MHNNGGSIIDSVERLMANGRLDEADLVTIEGDSAETAPPAPDLATVRGWREQYAVPGAVSLVSAAKC